MNAEHLQRGLDQERGSGEEEGVPWSDRVAALKRSVEQGSYRVGSYDIASRLLDPCSWRGTAARTVLW